MLWSRDGAEVKVGAQEWRGRYKEAIRRLAVAPEDVGSRRQAWKKRPPERTSLEHVPSLGGWGG